jgi:hypothetical protein
MTVILDDRFKLRRGTAANLATVNEVPLEGEIVYETDQGLTDGKYKIKIGDGITHYNDLAYVSLGGGIESIVPGTGISVDDTDPKSPIVTSTLGSIALSGYPDDYAHLPSGLGPSNAGKAYMLKSDRLIYIWDGAAFPSSGSGIRTFGRNIVTTSLSTPISTTNTSIPYSTAIPTKTQGDEIAGLTVTLYPKSTSSAIHVNARFPVVANSEAGRGFRFALFRDGNTNASAAAYASNPSVGSPGSAEIDCYLLSGSTAATTFKVRWGVSGGIGYLGRDATVNPLFGGVAGVSLIAEEL